jgi:hypothetical protein
MLPAKPVAGQPAGSQAMPQHRLSVGLVVAKLSRSDNEPRVSMSCHDAFVARHRAGFKTPVCSPPSPLRRLRAAALPLPPAGEAKTGGRGLGGGWSRPVACPPSPLRRLRRLRCLSRRRERQRHAGG